jgi:hypothetical protein
MFHCLHNDEKGAIVRKSGLVHTRPLKIGIKYFYLILEDFK